MTAVNLYKRETCKFFILPRISVLSHRQVSGGELFNGPSLILAFGDPANRVPHEYAFVSRKCLRITKMPSKAREYVLCLRLSEGIFMLTAQTFVSCLRPANSDIGLLMTGTVVTCLMSLAIVISCLFIF